MVLVCIMIIMIIIHYLVLEVSVKSSISLAFCWYLC